MRKLVLAALIISMSFSGAADLDSVIAQSCPSNYEPIVSMADPDATYNNIGTKDMYDYKVCVEGIPVSNVGMTCRGSTGFYMSSKSTDAHFSEVDGYNMRVCTGNMITEVKTSCYDNETALFTVSDRINGFGRHIGGLSDGYDEIVCGRLAVPSEMTVELNFNLSSTDRAYFDDQEVEDFYYSSIAEFPYLVLQSQGEVAGLVSPEFLSVERDIGELNRLRMRRDVKSDGVFVPFTRGSHEQIEDEQEKILDREFLTQMNPNFGNFPGDKPVIRSVLLKSGVELKSNISLNQGTHTVTLLKTGENEITISER